MRITPLDIKKQEFTRALRGFDTEEVQAFLDMVAGEWEKMVDKHRRLEDRVDELASKVDHYQKVEEALQEALETARENAQKTVKNAEREADLIVHEARMKAKEILRPVEKEQTRLERETERLKIRQDEILSRLRAFLRSELELVSDFKEHGVLGTTFEREEDPVQFSKRSTQGAEASEEEAEDDAPSASIHALSAPREQPADPSFEEMEALSVEEHEGAGGDEDVRPDGPRSAAGVRAADRQLEKEEEQHAWDERSRHEAAEGPRMHPSPEPAVSSSSFSGREDDDGDDAEHRQESSTEEEEETAWRVRQMFTAERSRGVDAPSEPEAADEEPADEEGGAPSEPQIASSSEEIDKIRRIIDDLDSDDRS